MSKVSIDDIRRASGEAVEKAEVVEETTGAVSGGISDPGINNGLQQLIELKKAEKELEEVFTEDKGGGLSDAISEALKDPDIRKLLTSQIQARQNQNNQPPAENHQSEPQPFEEPGGGGGGSNADDTYHTLMTVLNNVATMKPNMTATEMVEYANENEEDIKSELEVIS